MKIKYQIILLLTAMVMLLGGCGKKNTVVTGRYYYPDQEKDAKTEETSDDADESAETTEKNEAVIGSDQFLIKTNDMQEECLTLEQIASGKEYVYYYTLATRFLDKYGNRTAVSYFEPVTSVPTVSRHVFPPANDDFTRGKSPLVGAVNGLSDPKPDPIA